MAFESKYWYLHNHNLFSQLNEDNIKDLSVITGFIKANRNDIIDLSDGKVKRIYILKKGIMKIIQCDKNSNEQISDIIEQGDIFGEVYSKIDRLSSQYAQAVTEDVIICSFTLENFENMLTKNPSVALKFFNLLNDKIQTLQRQNSSIFFTNTKTRLLNFLTAFSINNGIREDKIVSIKNYLTHQDLADIIGCTRQTVSTLMQELVSENKIDYNRAYMKIFLD